MKNLQIGDKVAVTIQGVTIITELKNKNGVFWILKNNHPKDCCGLISEQFITKVS